jgi:hypothetical protein
MKAYVWTTGAVFALIAGAHAFRIVVEPHVAREAPFMGLTAFCVALTAWAGRLLWTSRG